MGLTIFQLAEDSLLLVIEAVDLAHRLSPSPGLLITTYIFDLSDL
jgi:hypothetical protein